MAVEGPDKGYSWVIVACGLYINFALFGLFRSAGLMYVALLETYNATREEVSWPFSLCAAVFQFSGVLSGVLCHYISQRTCCLIGSVIGTIGLAACYFAESIAWINIFYGIIHGVGYGLLVLMVPVFINQYFIKYRATAMGIALSGSTIASIIYPIIMEWLLDSYGINGTFLILSGIVMNTIIASMLMRMPQWLETSRTRSVSSKSHVNGANVKNIYVVVETNPIEEKPNGNKICTMFKDEDGEERKSNDNSSDVFRRTLKSADHSNEPNAMTKNGSFKVNKAMGDDGALFSESDENTDRKGQKEYLKIVDMEASKPLVEKNAIKIVPSKPKAIQEKPHSAKENKLVFVISNILKQYIFYLISITITAHVTCMHSYMLTIVDFAQDKGIPNNEGAYIIILFSATDLIGRSCLGWLTDKGFIGRKTLLSVNLAVVGCLFQLYPFMRSLVEILIVSVISGVFSGSTITLFFLIQGDYFELNKLPLVIGMSNFINGLISLTRPLIIGLFRDTIGSYNWMYHSLGLLLLMLSSIWTLNIYWTGRDEQEKESRKKTCDNNEA